MIYTLIGIENVDYISKRTNKAVRGSNVYLSRIMKENGRGQAVEKYYISAASCSFDELDDLSIGSEVEIYFDKFGRVYKICEV